MSGLTLVTGLWNIKRDGLSEGWSRSFQHYLDKFEQLLQVENNMIIFGDSELESFVFERRTRENTMFITRSQDWFKNEFYDKIQEIRTNPNWYNQAGWLSESTQAKLELYNPLVMSKVFLLNDAKIMDSFDSEQMFWIDAGLTNTVHPGYFTHDKVLNKLSKYTNKFSFVCFPYEANTEIHGFTYDNINQIAGTKVDMVARGGFFGGPKSLIGDINGIYYNLLSSTLSQNLMGTEESIFTIMCYKHSVNLTKNNCTVNVRQLSDIYTNMNRRCNNSFAFFNIENSLYDYIVSIIMCTISYHFHINISIISSYNIIFTFLR